MIVASNRNRQSPWPLWVVALAAAGLGGFFTALAGRVRELYAQAGTAQELGGGPE